MAAKSTPKSGSASKATAGKKSAAERVAKPKSNGKPTDAQQKAMATKVAKMRADGSGWGDIIKATGVKGPATARKLMKQFGVGTDTIQRRGGGGGSTTKKTASRRSAKKATVSRASGKGKGKGTTARRGSTRRGKAENPS